MSYRIELKQQIVIIVQIYQDQEVMNSKLSLLEKGGKGLGRLKSLSSDIIVNQDDTFRSCTLN